MAESSTTQQDFVGTWQLNHSRSDDFEPFLAEVGAPWLIRKVAKRGNAQLTLTLPEEGKVTLLRKTMVFTKQEEYILNELCTFSSPMGDSVSLWAWRAPHFIARGPLPASGKIGPRVVQSEYAISSHEGQPELVITITVIEHELGGEEDHAALLAGLSTDEILPGTQRLSLRRVFSRVP